MNEKNNLQGYRTHAIGQQTREAFGEEFAVLLAERTERFTMRDSTSVRVETAEALAQGIFYCIDLHLRTASDETEDTASLKALYEAGVMDAKRLAKRGKLMLRQTEMNRPPISNIGLNDTLSALPFFFRRYDADFFAHEIPCDIDYPLCIPISETLLGVEYINEYLRRLMLEHAFLRKFSPSLLEYVYQSQYGDYDGLLVNLYAPVAEAAVGRALAGKSVKNLFVDAFDRNLIWERFVNLPDESAQDLLKNAASHVCDEVEITGDLEQAYLKQAAFALLPRMRSAVGPEGLKGAFAPAEHISPENKPKAAFCDGRQMDDVRLRRLIAELQDCRYVTDQVAEIRRSVHSVRDIVEILDAIAADGLCNAIIDSMDERERNELRKIAAMRIEMHTEKGAWEGKLRPALKRDNPIES